jgi:hypothetical protein
MSGAFALGPIAFGKPRNGQRSLFQSTKFEESSAEIKTMGIAPSNSLNWLFSNNEYIMNDFTIWDDSNGNICEYHENICICRPAGAATYTDYKDCLAQMSAIPRYSVACGHGPKPNQPLAENPSLSCKWKHDFMAAIVPEIHCKQYIGPENITPDGEGTLKCVDGIECPTPFPLANDQQLLDGTAQALGEPIGSNGVDHDFVLSTDPVYVAA